MEPTKPKLPGEAIQLYNLFIHGEISRREFMAGVQRFAVGGLTAAAIIEALMPNYALGQQVSKTDDRINATYETVSSPQGNGIIKGYLVRPVSADTRNATPTKLPGIIVVHENRGLNPHIEDIARRLALANFMAFAPDGLTTVGGFPGDDYKGGLLFSSINSQQDDRRFRGRRALAEIASLLHGQDRSHRFLLRGQHRQYPGRPAGSGSCGGSAVLRRRSTGRGHSENSGGNSGPSRGTRHPTRSIVAGV